MIDSLLTLTTRTNDEDYVPGQANLESCIDITVYRTPCLNGRAPEHLAEFCHSSVNRRPGMISADRGKPYVPRTQTSFGDKSFVRRRWSTHLEQPS